MGNIKQHESHQEHVFGMVSSYRLNFGTRRITSVKKKSVFRVVFGTSRRAEQLLRPAQNSCGHL